MAQKSSVDIYTALLGLSLFAIIMAIIFLLLEMAAYNWDHDASDAGGIVMRPTPAARTMAEPSVHAMSLPQDSAPWETSMARV